MSTETRTRTITLASASPRRDELLRLTGWNAHVCPVEVDEFPLQDEPAEELVKRVALAKARTAIQNCDESGILLAADTVVADGQRLLGKPSDQAEATEMLWDLRGREHRVLTTIVIIDQHDRREVLITCESSVPMRKYTIDEVEAYIYSGAPLDKAGGYGIQDSFNPVAIERFHDCYANVMGLPLCHLIRAMRHLGQSPSVDVPEACQSYLEYDCSVYSEILGDQV
ncbi:MAG: septum formation protein Maf [Anaerolineaceae bacterium]|nr:MAG: septum formation protein Maf [Anaerolineaceae bacterium]